MYKTKKSTNYSHNLSSLEFFIIDLDKTVDISY